jgi:hypothetical protein
MKAIDKQSERVEIRISRFEKLLLKARAEAFGISISELVRSTTLSKQIKPARTSEEMEAYMLLKNFLYNFGRISNAFKKKDYTDLHREILEVKVEIMKHLKMIENGK